MLDSTSALHLRASLYTVITPKKHKNVKEKKSGTKETAKTLVYRMSEERREGRERGGIDPSQAEGVFLLTGQPCPPPGNKGLEPLHQFSVGHKESRLQAK